MPESPIDRDVLGSSLVRASHYAIGALLLVGFGYSVWLGSDLRYPDERDYLRITDSICSYASFSRDGGKTPSAFRPPGYPGLLAPLRCAGAPIALLRYLNFAALAGSAWLLGKALERSHGAAARAIGSLIVVAYPLFFYSAGTLYPQVLALFALSAMAERLTATKSTGSLSWPTTWILMAASVTVVLSVPPLIGAVAAWLVGLAWVARSSRIRLVLPVIAIALAVGVWTARNAVVLGAPIPFSTNSGLNLLLGNSPATTPSSGVDVDIREHREAMRGRNEVERDRYYGARAREWISHNPNAAAALYAGKLAYFFNYTNTLATESERSGARDWILLASYVPLALAAVTALALAVAGRRSVSEVEVFALLALAATAALYAVYFARLRFRVPVEPAFMLLAAPLLAEIGLAAPRRPSPRTACR